MKNCWQSVIVCFLTSDKNSLATKLSYVLSSAEITQDSSGTASQKALRKTTARRNLELWVSYMSLQQTDKYTEVCRYLWVKKLGIKLEALSSIVEDKSLNTEIIPFVNI